MEAIIEKLLLIKEEQILNTPLDDLDLSTRVYRSLCRSRVRTVRDVAEIWTRNLKVRNIGERTRCEILGALQAWCLSLPNFTNPATAEDQAENQGDAPDCDPDLGSPIDVLHLSHRTYLLLRRNRIHTLADLYQRWHMPASLRKVGPKTRAEVQRALEALHPAKNDFADRSTADAVDYETMSEVLTKKHVITESGVVVRVDLLQAEETRRPREERWRNISPKPQDYSPKNIFQAIGKGQNKISTACLTNNSNFEQDLQANNLIKSKVNHAALCSPIRGREKTLDGSVPENTEWLEMSLELLEKARRSRQVRTIRCPVCMTVTLSIRLKKHLVNKHPQAFRELQKAVSRR